MKKIILLILILVFLNGCSWNNISTEKVSINDKQIEYQYGECLYPGNLPELINESDDLYLKRCAFDANDKECTDIINKYCSKEIELKRRADSEKPVDADEFYYMNYPGLIDWSGAWEVTKYRNNNNFDQTFKVSEAAHIPFNIFVKYRLGAVDIAHSRFEYLDTTGSSFVKGAWYEEDNKYMIIKLKDTYYHYCGLPTNTWLAFNNTTSFGTYYNTYIIDNFDCRSGYVPSYN